MTTAPTTRYDVAEQIAARHLDACLVASIKYASTSVSASLARKAGSVPASVQEAERLACEEYAVAHGEFHADLARTLSPHLTFPAALAVLDMAEFAAETYRGDYRQWMVEVARSYADYTDLADSLVDL